MMYDRIEKCYEEICKCCDNHSNLWKGSQDPEISFIEVGAVSGITEVRKIMESHFPELLEDKTKED